MKNITKPTLEEVITLFVSEVDVPTREHVLDFVRSYPAYQKEIIEFAAHWVEQEASPASTADPDMEARVARRMESAVLNQLAQGDDVLAPGTGITATLHNLAERKKRSLQDVARALDLRFGVVRRLNARQVVPETIPDEVTAGIADYLASTVEQVYEALAGPGRRAWRAAAGTSPAAEPPVRITYAEAVVSAANDEAGQDGSGKDGGRKRA